MTEQLTKAQKIELREARAAARKRLRRGGPVVRTVDRERAAEIVSRAHHNRVPAPGALLLKERSMAPKHSKFEDTVNQLSWAQAKINRAAGPAINAEGTQQLAKGSVSGKTPSGQGGKGSRSS